MQKSASAPSGAFPPATESRSTISPWSSQTLNQSRSVKLDGVERHKLPLGVSRTMASRMRLDATLSPAMLDLRMNTRNLINEMKYNGNKIVSHQFALMKPRKNTKFERPKDLSQEKEMKRLQRKMTRLRKKTLDQAQALEVAQKQAAKVRQSSPNNALQTPADEKEEESKYVALDDPSLENEIARLLEDPRIEKVWRTMQGQDGVNEEVIPGLPRSRVKRSLEALGHADPDPLAVEEAIASLPQGEGPLDLNEFTSIVAVFNRQRRIHLKEAFSKLDEDSSGTVNIREFRHLLWDLGYTVTHETVTELLGEVDNDHSGEIEFSEFEYACELVHQRHGFSRLEVEEFENLFDRYDADGSNEMEADELASAMGWFGSAVTLEQASNLIARFDDDGNGCLAKPEFLAVMRIRLEEEISELRSLFCQFDADDSGTMDGVELLHLFWQCGYTITADVIEDAMRVVLPLLRDPKTAQLIFEDVLKVFYLVRKREGFSAKELEELTDIYNRHDKGAKGEIREFELGRCLNWMGYPLSQQRRRELWCRVDVDKTESIELGEFLKLVRLLREEETNAAREILEKCEHVRGSSKSALPEESLAKMLLALGYCPPNSIIKEAMRQSADSSGDGSIDVFGVLGILRFIREKQVEKLRANAGISDQQANKVKSKFGMRLEHGKHVELHEFEKVMCDMFPAAKHQPGEKERIRHLIKEQTQGRGFINELMEAFWIVRMFADMRDEDKWNREQDCAHDAGFTHWQVASFREAFVAADSNADGCLSEREIQMVFENLMALNLNQFEAMNKEFANMGNKRDCIEFCDFLRLMHVILGSGR